MIRFGLCCKFLKEPIHFKTATVTGLARMPLAQRREKIDSICAHNAQSLKEALEFCSRNDIGSFRVNSQILPVKTHPEVGYDVKDLPSGRAIIKAFKECRQFAGQNNIRISFHPDQFVVLNSPNKDVVFRSIEELRYQTQVAEWIGADVINLHAGGVYGDRKNAVKRLRSAVKKLPQSIKTRLTLENDDKSYTPEELIPLCLAMGIPFVYDVHHHRCLPDGLTVGQATCGAIKTWKGREPLFHISSPKEGWKGTKTFRHHDYIQIKDFPQEWKGLDMTIEVEAKAKEAAIKKLMKDLKRKGII